MIFIRTDANEKIATGHIMRCMTVAKELIVRKQKVQFLVSDSASVVLLIENGFEFTILDTKWNWLNSQEEIKKLKFILEKSYEDEHRIPLLFVDSYFVSSDYFKELKSFAKLAMFDDLCKDVYDVDLLINYNITYTLFNYEQLYSGKNIQLLLGPQYTPLRMQFLEYVNSRLAKQNQSYSCSRDKVSDKPIQVLLICGGGDPLNILIQILKKASEKRNFANYYFHVVMGAYNPNIKELEVFERMFSNIKLYYNVANMAELMSECDIAISAASTVLYECCSLGLPTIFFVIAENQEKDAQAFAKDECMVYAGDMRKNCIDAIESIFKALHKLAEDPNFRMRMSKHMQEIVDGRGTERIVNLFCRTFEIGSFYEENLLGGRM